MGLRIIIKLLTALVGLVLLLDSRTAIGQCLGLIKGNVQIDVKECKVINPKEDFRKDADLSFINNLSANDKKRFFDGYLGLLIKGLVVYSEAIKTDMGKDKGVLYLSRESFFISSLNNTQIKSCENLNNKRIATYLEEHCCMGGVDSPCLLPTSYELKNIKVIGDARGMEELKKQRIAKIENLKEAFDAIKKRDYEKAVEFFTKAKNEQQLDTMGYYFFAYAYKKLDKCHKVIKLLEENQKFDAEHAKHMDEEKYYRKANYLLARCYARLGNAAKATALLGFYLIQPQKYKFEISDSLKNKDFGWIYSSKEYQEYKVKAQEILKSLK